MPLENGTPSWDELAPVSVPAPIPAPEGSTSARGPSGLQSSVEPHRRNVWERTVDAANDAFLEFSPMAALGRALGTYDPELMEPGDKLGDPVATARRAKEMADQSRANREAIAAREAADPAWRPGGSVWGNIGREVAQFGGGAVGGAAGDPTTLIAPGEGIIAKMLGQAAVGGGVDAALQGVEMGQGVRDAYDPLQTGISAAGGASLVGLAHGAGKLVDVWRGVPNEPGGAIPDLQDVTLDGPGGAAGAVDVDATLRSVGYAPEMFSTPELAAQMAQRIAGAQSRVPNIPPEILAERAGLASGIETGDVDPSRAPPPLDALRTAIPPDVTLSAHPELGTARMDDLGGIIATMRHMAARDNVLEQGAAQADANPTIAAILNSTANLDQQAGTIWKMIADMDRRSREVPEGTRPVDANPADVAPFQRSTVEAARGEHDGLALPVKGRITSKFGQREAPIHGASTNHQGIDIAAARGSSVAAPSGGTVVMAGEAGPNGNLVRIDHGNGVVSSYAHLDRIGVKIGDKVNPGDIIGNVGSTGRSTGPHLHYAIRENGAFVDPATFRFAHEEAPRGPDYVVPPREADAFDTSGGFERERAQRSPTQEELDAGKFYETPEGTFTSRRGRPYEHPMATRGDEPRRPGMDDPEEAPPGFKWSDERGEGPMPAPDSPSPGGGPRSGPGSGKGFFEDQARQKIDDLMREYEASRARRQERQSNQSRERDPADRFKKYGQKPHQTGDTWHMTEDGIIADKDMNPVAFRNAREAAKWATANSMAGDFELHTWGTNSERVILKRRANSSYGEAPPRPEPADGPQEPAAGRSPDTSQRAIGSDAFQASSPKETRGGSGNGPPVSSPGKRTLLDDVEDEIDQGVTDPQRRADISEYLNDLTDPEKAASPEVSQRAVAALGKLEAARTETNHQVVTEPVKPTKPPLQGKSETVVTPAGRKVDVQHEVRELADVRQAKGDMQPRDRSRDASDVQINDIAAKLDPEQLHGNRQAAHGAPIITDEGHLATGNGRARAIERAYEAHPENAAAYRKMIEAQGFDTKGFERPILVRRMKEKMAPEDMRQFVKEAQESGTMRMSAPERAKADAGSLSDDALESYRGGELNSAGNRDFVKRWLKETGADANEVLARDGTLSPEGVKRVQASILHRAFDDDTLVSKLLGDTDNNIKAIGNVLLDAAPKFAQVRALAKAGDIPREFDISGKVAEMAGLISRSRAEETKLGDLLGQSDMFGGDVDPLTESLVRLMFKDDELTKPRSQPRLKEGFDFYLEDAKAQAKGKGMFDDEAELRPVDIVEAARAKLDAKEGPIGQGSFYKVVSDRKGGGSASGARSLNDRLRAARIDADPEQRELIDRLLSVRDTEGTIRTGGMEGDVGPGKQIAGQADLERNTVHLAHADDLETLLHESVHLRLMRRYGEEFDELRPGDAGVAPARELIKLYNEARQRFGKYGFWNRKAAGHTTEYALSSVDEFIAEALTSPKFQRWLQRGTIWNRMVDGFRKVLGLPARFKPMLDDALRSGKQLLEAADRDPVRVGQGPSGAPMFGRKGTFNKIVDKDGLTRDVEKLRAAIGEPGAALKSIFRPIKDGVSWLTYSADARGRAVADRINSAAAHELMDHFFARPGMFDKEAVGRTYHEAVQHYGTGRSQQAFRVIEPILNDEAAQRRVADLLRFPNKKGRATAAELEMAKELRGLLKEAIDYRKEAGEDIGEVADGYFPRWIDVEKVISNPDDWLKRATKLYSGLGVKDPEGAAQGWLNRVVDTYAGLDGGLDIRRATGDAVGSMTAKGREFGKQADALLGDYYQHDLLQVLSQYFHGAARRAEQTRRFGRKGPVGSPERAKWEAEHGDKDQLDVLTDRIREDARAAGTDASGVLGVLQGVYSANLGHIGAVSKGVRNAVAWAHTWTQLGVMDHVAATSLGENMMGFVRGGLKRGLPYLHDSFRYFARELRRATPDEVERMAEAIGVVEDAVVNEALLQRSGIEGGTPGSQKLLSSFYRAILLHQLTMGQRKAAVRMSQELIRQWSHELLSPNARKASRARKYLAEAGVKNVDKMAERVRAGGFDAREVGRDASPEAADYGTAVLRIVDQSNMRPTRAVKPVWAGHPVGSMIFSLLSYNLALKKNVLDRAGRMVVAGVKDGDPTLFQPAIGLTLLGAYQYLYQQYGRPAVFGGKPMVQPGDNPISTAVAVADRAGLTGGASPLVNAIYGVKYDRSLSESMLGPVLGRPLDMGTKFVELETDNSKRTNTAERAAAGAVYDNVVEPGLDGLASARLLGVARSAAVLATGNRAGGALPADRDAFVDAVAGPAKKKHKGG